MKHFLDGRLTIDTHTHKHTTTTTKTQTHSRNIHRLNKQKLGEKDRETSKQA
jgi:hypothetical protein